MTISCGKHSGSKEGKEAGNQLVGVVKGRRICSVFLQACYRILLNMGVTAVNTVKEMDSVRGPF